MRTMLVHGVLAFLGLIVAWWVTTSEAEEDGNQDQVQLFSCAQLVEVEYTAQGRSLLVKRREAEGEPFYWLTVTPRASGETNPNTPPAEPEPEPTYYLVDDGESSEEWFQSFQPLTALRSLGDVGEDLIEGLGLGDDADLLRIRCQGSSVKYLVGASTYGAQAHRYLRERDGGPVYLVAKEFISKIAQADSQLAQRAMHGFERSEVEKLEVQAESKTITLLQRDRHNAQAAIWVDASKPEERNDLYGNWLSRVEALSVRSYLALGSEPGSELEQPQKASTVLQLIYRGEGGEQLGSLALARADNPENPAVPFYYAKSEQTRSWTSVPYSVARDVENNARLVLGLDPLPEPAVSSEPPASESPSTDPPANAVESPPAARPVHGGQGHGATPAGHPPIPSAGHP